MRCSVIGDEEGVGYAMREQCLAMRELSLAGIAQVAILGSLSEMLTERGSRTRGGVAGVIA